MIPVLGVDPGTSGAACLLGADGRTVIAWWGWQHRDRVNGDVWQVAQGGEPLIEWPTLASAIASVDVGGGYALVVEGLAPHQKSSKASLISLGETAGVAIGVLEPGAATPTLRPKAEVWRRQCLSTARMDGKAWDRLARRVVAAQGYVGLGRGYEVPHVADAVLLARWGWERQREEARR